MARGDVVLSRSGLRLGRYADDTLFRIDVADNLPSPTAAVSVVTLTHHDVPVGTREPAGLRVGPARRALHPRDRRSVAVWAEV